LTARKVALLVIAISTAALGAAYATAFRASGPAAWAPAAFIIGVASLLVAFMILGAITPGRRQGALLLVFAATWLIVAVGFLVVLKLPPETDAAKLLAGLPLPAAIVIYGVGLLPALILPIAYAMTFDTVTLREEDIERVRALAQSRKSNAS
jgi:hypothetical protein